MIQVLFANSDLILSQTERDKDKSKADREEETETEAERQNSVPLPESDCVFILLLSQHTNVPRLKNLCMKQSPAVWRCGNCDKIRVCFLVQQLASWEHVF